MTHPEDSVPLDLRSWASLASKQNEDAGDVPTFVEYARDPAAIAALMSAMSMPWCAERTHSRFRPVRLRRACHRGSAPARCAVTGLPLAGADAPPAAPPARRRVLHRQAARAALPASVAFATPAMAAAKAGRRERRRAVLPGRGRVSLAEIDASTLALPQPLQGQAASDALAVTLQRAPVAAASAHLERARVQSMSAPSHGGDVRPPSLPAGVRASRAWPGQSPVPAASSVSRELAGYIAPAATAKNILEQVHVGLPMVFGAMSVYSSMLAGTFIGLGDRVERLPAAEAFATRAAGSVLAASAIASGVRLVRARAPPKMSDVAMVATNAVAASSNLLMGTVGTPVLVDPITGTSQHMVRWCEWTALGFLMTFVVEALNAHTLWEPLSLSLLIGWSVACGYVFPLCSNGWVWGGFMLSSLAAFLRIYPRCLRRLRLHRAAQGACASPSQVCDVVSARVAHQLMVTCVVMWTVITLDYFAKAALVWRSGAAHAAGTERPSWPFVSDCVLDVIAKLAYARIVAGAHAHVPEEARRQQERWIREAMDTVFAGADDTVILSEMRPDGTARSIASKGVAAIVGEGVGARWAAWRAHFVGCERWEGFSDATLSSHGSDASASTVAPGTAAEAQEALEHLVASAWHSASAVAKARGQRAAPRAGAAVDTITMRWEAPAKAGATEPMWCDVQATRCTRALAGSRAPSVFLVVVIRDVTAQVRMAEAERAQAPWAPAPHAEVTSNVFTPHKTHKAVLARCDALVRFHVHTTESFRALDVEDTASLQDGLQELSDKLEHALRDEGTNADHLEDGGHGSEVLLEMQQEVRSAVRALCAEVSSYGASRWADTRRALATIKGELASLDAVSGEANAADVSQYIDELLARDAAPHDFQSTAWAELRAAIGKTLQA